jgi:flagellar hook-basal body complex protein FliE
MALGSIGSIGGINPITALRGGTSAAIGGSGDELDLPAIAGGGIATGGIAGGGIGTAGNAAAGAGNGSFIDALADAAAGLNSELVGADAAMADFAAGGSADLHSVVLQMQEASLQLKLGVQVRDRLLEAYQDIMRLQV